MKTKNDMPSILAAITVAVLLSACNPEDTSTSQEQSNHQQASNVEPSSHGPDGAPHTHEDGDGHHDQVPGPNGGRLIVEVEPHLEFLVTEEHHAQITFVNDDIEPIPPAELDIALIAGDRTGPVEIGFTQKDNILLSDTPLPKEHNTAIILQISGGKNEEPVFERFHLNMETCPDCQLHEYACICGHTH